MSTDHAVLPRPTATPSYAGPATSSVLVVAVAAGVVLGVVDQWWSTAPS
jgi:small neutral amino acid transporter SnatA (MarC family)